MNSFEKLYQIGIGIIMIFIIPFIYFSQKFNILTLQYVKEEMYQFSNNVCEQGYLSSTMYREFIKKINKTGMTFVLEITHEKLSHQPLYEKNLEEHKFTSEISTYYIEISTDEVIKCLEENSVYQFNRGDIFHIALKDRNYFDIRNILNRHERENYRIFAYDSRKVRS